ncbi:GNAT superfamily N-acetyltransferase [Nocardioides sp. BE266]|uniref:GNAT family N-acetyltransferase n=1 Tax=Nocardioides sp. BE266 TaxID=2817725 RepID=UPI00285D8608|nr:GNAT family N-acetyltransferase [Nocardioides sp. BE266]MDR7251172.1 GNAT superfamily N-acetyltransferase [Nocardioides sp. BE266]
MTDHAVRPARARDLPLLAAIEDSGLPMFEEVLGDLTGDPLASPAVSGRERAAEPGFILVAGDPAVGFAHVRDLESHAHLDQISVHPDHARRGIGTALLEAAAERAALKGHGTLTLTTYADLAWNAPFYARHGFVEVSGDEPRTASQLAISEAEEALGLARHGRRIWMRRVLRTHRTAAELTAFLPVLDAAPRDIGVLRAVVRRPAAGEREVLEVGHLDVTDGLVGDTWAVRGSRNTPDGSAHPDMQLNIMSQPLVEFLAQDPERERLAGDQMFVDLDLSHANLPAWSELHIGGPEGAVVVVTEQPHNGCAKFIARFGKEAMTFVNGPEGKPRRLRGLCAKVVRPGPVRPGDEVVVVRPGPSGE